MLRRWATVLGVLSFLLVGAQDALGGVQYTQTLIYALSGDSQSVPSGINSSGQVVGASYAASGGISHAFLYSNGIVTNLGTLGGARSWAAGINDNGQVVGSAYTTLQNGVSDQHAFIYSNGTMTDLGTLGGTGSAACAINNLGQVVGISCIKGSDVMDHGFIYSNGTMTDLGKFEPSAINDAGQVVGTCGGHAFLYSNGTMTDLGTLGDNISHNSGAYDINAGGQVVGWTNTPKQNGYYHSHAFLYSNGTMTDLGTLQNLWAGADSLACGINSSGQVVGNSGNPSSGAPMRAFIYSNGKMTDLTSLIAPLSSPLSDAYAINDVGQIAATDGLGHTVLLTPLPEPSTLVLLSIGGISLLVYVWQRWKLKP